MSTKKKKEKYGIKEPIKNKHPEYRLSCPEDFEMNDSDDDDDGEKRLIITSTSGNTDNEGGEEEEENRKKMNKKHEWILWSHWIYVLGCIGQLIGYPIISQVDHILGTSIPIHTTLTNVFPRLNPDPPSLHGKMDLYVMWLPFAIFVLGFMHHSSALHQMYSGEYGYWVKKRSAVFHWMEMAISLGLTNIAVTAILNGPETLYLTTVFILTFIAISTGGAIEFLVSKKLKTTIGEYHEMFYRLIAPPMPIRRLAQPAETHEEYENRMKEYQAYDQYIRDFMNKTAPIRPSRVRDLEREKYETRQSIAMPVYLFGMWVAFFFGWSIPVVNNYYASSDATPLFAMLCLAFLLSMQLLILITLGAYVYGGLSFTVYHLLSLFFSFSSKTFLAWALYRGFLVH